MSDKKRENIENVRHSLSHVMAAAVLDLFPDTRLAIGPAIENGFYYDFDVPRALTPDDLPAIEAKMRDIISSDIKFVRREEDAKKAYKAEEKKGDIYKAELIADLISNGTKNVSFYSSGEFEDLCAGPHVASTKELRSAGFKLTKIAGAYWRGDEKNKMLQRIYAVAFESPKELRTYLANIEEAEKRDHRKLGPALGLFMFHETAPGMPYWLPKGLIVNNELIKFWRKEHQARGYQEIKTPLINKKELYELSGHWDHYQEEMFISKTDEKETYALKPMNCPNAMVVYGFEKRSYRDLPLRLSDTDTLHRFERSGTLNGLLRAREFSQDDAHIFVSEEGIAAEIKEIFKIVDRFYSVFNLEYSFRLGTRPKEFMGEAKIWDKAEKELKSILIKSGKKHTVLEGDGAFYGPKIDIIMKDSLDREWQMGTIQLDFQIPRRFKLTYTDKDGKQKTPVVLHRVIYGSIERFMGILTEHTAGEFPLWLAPVQVSVASVAKSYNKYAGEVAKELTEAGLRVIVDESDETVGKKIRNAELSKIPFILVVGEREQSKGQVAVRKLHDRKIETMKISKFMDSLKN